MVDPVIHRIASHQNGVIHLLEDRALKARINVPQEQKLRGPVLRLNFWGKIGEDIQLRFEGLGDIQVETVLPAPAKSPAGLSFQAGDVYALFLEEPDMRIGEILSNDSHHADLGEVSCRETEISC